MSARQHPALLAWPDRAKVQRVLPKSKFYEYGQVGAKIRELFVRQVEQITLQYALAPSTTNLPPRDAVPEIHVLRIDLKTREVDFEVLRCIDAVWRFPTLFEMGYNGETRVVAAYKRPSGGDDGSWICSGYYATNWLPMDSERTAMPVALHLGGLYEQLLHRLIPLSARSQESLAELVVRVDQAQAKQRELDKTTARLAKEKQFNRKVEIYAALRQLKQELEQLVAREGYDKRVARGKQ